MNEKPSKIPEMVKCKCGGAAVYRGSGMVDAFGCDRCSYETSPYFDGAEWALQEWDKRNREVAA